MRFTLLTLSCLTLATACGCSAWDKKKSIQQDDGWSITRLWKKEYQEPSKLAVIWSPDTLATAGQPLSRGFGGRIYFYNERQQAVPVEGDLMVHAYLTTPGQDSPETMEADQKFEFSAEQLASHFSPSEIGASYSIWVPWDAATDGYREEITLIPTFKSSSGAVVQGSPAKVFLPGKERDKRFLKSPPTQTVSYRKESIPTYNPETRVARTRTTTINVPDDASFVRNKRASFTLGNQSNRRDAAGAPSAGIRVGGGGRLETVTTEEQGTAGPGSSGLPGKPSPGQTPSAGESKTPIDLKPIAPPPRGRTPVGQDPVAAR